MRLDEYGRWVSDDGAYIWDETAQVWQPATVSVPLPPPPATLGPDNDIPGPTGGQPDWLTAPDSSVGNSWPDPTWGATGEMCLPQAAQHASADPASTWSQSADPLDSGAYPLDADPLGTGSWPVQPSDPAASGGYSEPLGTGPLDPGTGSWQVQPADPLTDTGASWSAGHDLSANALWQSPDSAAASGWSAAAAVSTEAGLAEAVSPSTGATSTWDAGTTTGTGEFSPVDGSAGATPTGYEPTPGYASTSAYRTGEWSLAPDSADEDGDAEFPAAAPSMSPRRGGGLGRRPPQDDDIDIDIDEDFDEPRRGWFATLARSRGALLCLGLVAVMLLGFLTFVLIGGDDSSQQAAPGADSGRYDAEFRQSYLDTCIQASNNAAAADFCSCTLAKFEADYTQDEFVRLSSDSDGTESLQAVREVTESCRATQ
jgi:hypothetical protein